MSTLRTRDREHRRTPHRAQGPLRAVAALLLLSLPFVGPALGGDGRTDDDGGFSDEMVGTLPSLGGWLPLRESGYAVDDDAGFYLSGPIQPVVEALQQAVGSGYLSYELLGADRIRVDFHGEVSLEFDAALLGRGVTAGVRFGPESGPGLLALESAGRLVGPKAVGGGTAIPLPLGPFQAAGVLADGLEVRAFTRASGRRLVRLGEFEGRLFVEQTR